MGNYHTSPSHHHHHHHHHHVDLATPQVAKSMHFTKQQLMELYEACQQLAQGTLYFARKHFHAALHHAKIISYQDRDILTLLCTMWDVTGNGLIPSLEYCVSLVPLCCPGESIEQVLDFAWTMIDHSNNSKDTVVTSQDIVFLLKSICTTAGYFGDETLTIQQINTIADQVIIDTMTIVTESTELFEHWMVVQKISEHPLVVSLLVPSSSSSSLNPKHHHHHRKHNNNHQENSNNRQSILLNSKYSNQYHHHHQHYYSQPMKPFVGTRLENGSITDVSSVMLSPLVQIPIHHDSVTEF